MLYSGLICCFDVLKRARGFPVACSPRWTPLKGAFSSFQHLSLLQIPRLSNFKEICLQNSRIIVFTFFRRFLQGKITRGNQARFYKTWAVVIHDRERIEILLVNKWGPILELFLIVAFSGTVSHSSASSHLLASHGSIPSFPVCVAPSWKWYLQLLPVIITAITDARMTKQAAIQTFTYLCTSLAKSLHNFKTKTRAETSINRMWWHIKPYTKQSCAVIHFLLFYLFSSVFIRCRHKDERVRSTPDNMWITLD